MFFRGRVIGDFKADLIINEKVIVELKAVRILNPAHEAQLINYLKATNIEVGLLLNFGVKSEFKRFVYDNKRKNISDNQLKSVAEQSQRNQLQGIQSGQVLQYPLSFN